MVVHPYKDPEGTSAGFILVTVLSGSMQTFIRDMLAVIFPNCALFNERVFWITACVEFLLIYVPLAANVTIPAIQSPLTMVPTVVILTAIFVITVTSYRENLPESMKDVLQLRMCERRISVTYFRSFTNILAALCILAVDFPIFPKYEGKSKHYGTTFMDGGVGMYVVSGALVSPRARDRRQSVRQEMTDAAIMLVIGLCRLFLVTWTGYDVQVMEYGLHWNFFFTLAFIKVCTTFFYSSLPNHVIPFLGPIITLGYQYCLSVPAIYKFVMFGADGHFSRSNFIDSNREGIFSSVGYLALYLFGAEFGRLVMKKRQTVGEWCWVACICVGFSYGSYMLFTLSSVYFDKPSRQLANAAYIFFSLILMGVIIAVALFLEILTNIVYLTVRVEGNKDVTPPYIECPVLRAGNYNALFFFLVANLTTGTINMVMETRECSHVTSYSIITAYLFFLSTLILYMERKKMDFKTVLLKPFRMVNRRRPFTATTTSASV